MKMKLLSKTVDYFGLKLIVDKDTNYLTTSPEGSVIASFGVPELDPTLGWMYDWGTYTTVVAEVDLEGVDWKDTLVEVGL
jgi:hypothetical protein